MSDEKEVEKIEVVDSVKQTHSETIVPDASENPVEETPPEEKSKFEGFTPPVMLLLFAVVALFVILVVSLFNMDSGGSKKMTMDDPSVAALKSDIEASRMDLNRQRMENGLPPLAGGAEPMDKIAARLKQDADTLVSRSGSFERLLNEKDAQISEAADELIRSQQVRQSLSNELSKLRQDYQKSLVDGSEASALKMRLQDALTQRQAMSDELFSLRQELANSQGTVTEAQYLDMEQRYQEAARARDFFETRVKELEARVGQAQLFAESVEELVPAAVEVFRRLRKLEGMKDSDLTTEYSKLGVDLGANVLHTLSFATGSSELTDEDRQKLQSVAEEIPDGELAFIIGYASTTGDPAENETLSSDRATTAAEFYAGMKRDKQRVQAVYLGQTDRFSSESPQQNQLCEVWRIRRE